MDAVEGVGSIVSGFGRAAARRSAAKVADYEADITRIQGLQASAARQEQLTQALASIDAIRAGRNLSLDSPAGQAIRASRRRASRDAQLQEQLGFTLARVSKRSEAAAQRRAAPFEIIGGIAQGAGSFSRMANFGGGGG